MEGKEIIKLKTMTYFVDRFYKKLREPDSVVPALASLCGGCNFSWKQGICKRLSK